jgi:ABC-2 type transport system ATP-binding protein
VAERKHPSGAGPAGGIEVISLRRDFAAGKGLRKRGPVVTALHDLDLRVEPGEVHGLLGPNGAGKTTLCKVLSTVLLPTAGQVTVNGYDVVRQTRAVRRSIGIVLGGERGLYGRLTPRQTLRFWAAMYDVPAADSAARIDGLLDRVGLSARRDDRVETFSRGMKQRLHLARGLIGDPRLLLLDEPTTGMDPVATREFRRLLGDLHAEGRTILVTTHDMAEAEAVCDRVTLIDRGRVLATERPATIGALLSRFETVEVYGAPPTALVGVSALPGVARVSTDPGTGTTRIETEADGAAAAVLVHLGRAGVASVRAARPSLEDVYLHVIGERGLTVR